MMQDNEALKRTRKERIPSEKEFKEFYEDEAMCRECKHIMFSLDGLFACAFLSNIDRSIRGLKRNPKYGGEPIRDEDCVERDYNKYK